ncbi:MAG: 50S ribosomal protein L22 [Candidatus Wildermuthbacteria bacterium]|nr:50S ribosomal protein L22 [Candidatus Wildermuthbacteria bacterium]
MKATAKLRYLRIAPRKVRHVADIIRGKQVPQAETLLRFAVRKAADPILKTLRSAVASARVNHGIDETNLYISKITVDEGPKLKRIEPRARGAAYPIQKKSSHITIELEEVIPGKGAAIKMEPVIKEKAETQETEAKSGAQENDEKREYSPRRGAAKQRQSAKKGRGIQKIFRRKAV